MNLSEIYAVEYSLEDHAGYIKKLNDVIEENNRLFGQGRSSRRMLIGVFYNREYAQAFCRLMESMDRPEIPERCYAGYRDLSDYEIYEYSLFQKSGHIETLGSALRINLRNAIQNKENDFMLLGVFEPDGDEVLKFGRMVTAALRQRE